jgi:DNA-binding transcriptional MerR regulator/methylmalonyl-CoA mutase cobalamin-binding subunit
MKEQIRHPMQYAARQTGLKPYLIRTWEVRYGAVRPERSASNRRLYSDADIERLALLKKAVDGGHAISTVAPLSDQDLFALVQTRETQRHLGRKKPLLAAGGASDDAAQCIEAALEAILRLDASGLERVMTCAAVQMARPCFLQQVVMPLFTQIGSLWRAGDLKVVNEHLASVTVRSILWDMLRTIDVAATAPRILVATPVGHWHEIGAIAAALAASESGWRAYYFGPNLPSEEIAYAAQRLAARALCLSLGHRLDDYHLPIEITKLRRAVGNSMPLFVGGRGTDAIAGLAVELGIEIVNDLNSFRNRLEEFSRGR